MMSRVNISICSSKLVLGEIPQNKLNMIGKDAPASLIVIHWTLKIMIDNYTHLTIGSVQL